MNKIIKEILSVFGIDKCVRCNKFIMFNQGRVILRDGAEHYECSPLLKYMGIIKK